MVYAAVARFGHDLEIKQVEDAVGDFANVVIRQQAEETLRLITIFWPGTGLAVASVLAQKNSPPTASTRATLARTAGKSARGTWSRQFMAKTASKELGGKSNALKSILCAVRPLERQCSTI